MTSTIWLNAAFCSLSTEPRKLHKDRMTTRRRYIVVMVLDVEYAGDHISKNDSTRGITKHSIIFRSAGCNGSGFLSMCSHSS